MATYRRGRPVTVLLAAAALLLITSFEPRAQQPSLSLESVPAPLDGQSIVVDKQAPRASQARDDDAPVSVIVRLEDAPLASYAGGLPGLPATSPLATGRRKLDARTPDSQRYLAHLRGKQQEVAAQAQALRGGRVIHQYQATLNGFSMVVARSEVEALSRLPGVSAVYLDELRSLDTETSPAFVGAPAAWAALGGASSAGEGVVVGILDSGVWPEHPSFADPDPNGVPYPPYGGPAVPCEFGSAVPGDAPFTCNGKLVGARQFLATYKAVIGLLPNEFDSARDDNGHGTHTATTAAGNGGVPAAIFGVSRGTVSGIAPRARVINYRVCADAGCYASDSAAAINQAILDGVDVLNFSISGGTNPFADAVSLAFLDAYEAGVFVAASAGNAGPAANTVNHRAPWITTVAASTTTRQFQSTVTLVGSTGTLSLSGASVTAGIPSAAPVMMAPAGNELCTTPLAPGTATGAMVVCQRGVNARVDKGYNVLQGGAAGMILYNPTLQGLSTDNHFLPAVHLEAPQGAQLLAFLAANSGVTATLSESAAAPAQGDVMAAFSSRGGTGLPLGIAKPDITAPGVQILAGHTPMPATSAGGPPGELFQAIQGTSMSGPHVAGAGALLRHLHPDWTAGQIKSALMTTAVGAVVKEDGVTPAGPFDHGSGRLDLARAIDPGLTFDESGAAYVALQGHLWDANYPSLYVPQMLGQIAVSRTVRNQRGHAATWSFTVEAPSDLKIGVKPTLTVPARGTASFGILVDARSVPVGQVRHALLWMTRAGEAPLRFPITIVRATSAVVPLAKTCTPLDLVQGQQTDCTITMTNTGFSPVQVNLVDALPPSLRLILSSVVNATASGNTVAFSGTLGAAEPPNVLIGPGAGFGYLPLAGFGVAPVSGMGDESIVNFNVSPFRYAGEVWSRVGITSNGYLIVGGGTAADVTFVNQSFPSATPPNNVLAPYWTDLNFAAGGALRVANLTDGVGTWLVVEWTDVPEYSNPGNRHTFQVWIGRATNAAPEDIVFAYGPNIGNGDGGFLTVGAENRFGNRGQNAYVDGAGTLPVNGTQLRVTTAPGQPGETRTITFSAEAVQKGRWQNCAAMTSSQYYGTQFACVSGTVAR